MIKTGGDPDRKKDENGEVGRGREDFAIFLFLFFILIIIVIIIIINNFCIALFSGVPKLTALYNILQHFQSFTNVIHISMTTNNV